MYNEWWIHLGCYEVSFSSVFLNLFWYLWHILKAILSIQRNFNLTEYNLHGKRFRSSSSRKLEREQKKKGMRGEGKGSKGNACPQTPRFWKTAFAHKRSFWLVRCWYWLNGNQYINQTRYVLFMCVADLVWSDWWSQITNALVWYLSESCLCEGLSDLSPFNQKYNWRSSSGD